MGILSWITHVWKGGTPQALTVGTKVKTPHGYGEVISGSVNVSLDHGCDLRPMFPWPRVCVTTSLDKIELDDRSR